VLRSFVASCELAKVDPFAWFQVLMRIGEDRSDCGFLESPVGCRRLAALLSGTVWIAPDEIQHQMFQFSETISFDDIATHCSATQSRTYRIELQAIRSLAGATTLICRRFFYVVNHDDLDRTFG
jgi:hypothetical protein